MNFEDEQYVRLYIKRTVTNRRLGWEGRAVMHEMLYEFDRAGVFELDGAPEEAIELVTQLPQEVVKEGLWRLLKTKTWEVRGNRLIWPRYLEAQTAKRSDAARAAAHRARRRDGANESRDNRDDPSHGVTNEDSNERDEPSRGVTAPSRVVTPPDDPESRGVTVRHETSLSALHGSALPRSAVPSFALPSTSSTSPAAVAAAVVDEPPEDPGRELPCPADLFDRPGVQHMLRELAEKLPCPLASLEHEARDYIGHFTVGGGVGERRTNWPRWLRKRLYERFRAGDLKPPGAVEHEARSGKRRGGGLDEQPIAPSPYLADVVPTGVRR